MEPTTVGGDPPAGDVQGPLPSSPPISLADSAGRSWAEVAEQLGSSPSGLTAGVAVTRLAAVGPNAVRTHHARPVTVLGRQFRSPLLVLLIVAAVVSFYVGERTDAVIIGGIIALSVVLGFVNEYRAERAAEALHDQMRHRAVVRRSGDWTTCDVVELVPGDLVQLELGAVVPADLRLSSVTALQCDEAVLTGESLPAEKSAEPVTGAPSLGDLRCCAFMGTVVRAGSAEGIVVATGSATEFGRIALGLGERHQETEFQLGLRRFSVLLAEVAGVLTGSIFVINLVLARPVIDALLFSLAIAVGITPQLLPAVVTTSLATGSRRLARRRVLVKRLVCIEDLGDIELLLTDKTGTLTEGEITFRQALDPAGAPSDAVLLKGLLCTDTADAHGSVGANPLDAALWQAPGAASADLGSYRKLAVAPFDHDRRLTSVLVDGPDGRVLVTKGAPESVLERCTSTPPTLAAVLDKELTAGARVIAVAERSAPGVTAVAPGDEHDLELVGLLAFIDQPKASAAAALARLDRLGVTVKIVTGDHPVVAATVCRELGLVVAGTLTGVELDELDDAALEERIRSTTIFARVSPDQKSRVITAHRQGGVDVAYLGDGVNDAVALHHADVGISVDSATDVAKDAADIVLLEKDLDVLADGVVEGRAIFANTIKYVLMGTSSNFGNMFSAAAASAFLSFLPMLPSQILLNNLLYDSSQMTIPTDRVDEEQLARPSHWDMSFIRRFMLMFGPVSSIFDFMTFAVMLHVFHAGPSLFRSGWFVESLATQTLVIFVIRTRRVPFFRSRPSGAMLVASLVAVGVGIVLPASPWRHVLGFRTLPVGYFGALVAMIVAYLGLAELTKFEFYRHPEQPSPRRQRDRDRARWRVHRRAARFSHGGPLPPR